MTSSVPGSVPDSTTSAVTRPGGDATAAPARPRRAFRPEIQGLRAFAVLLVACYHIWFGRVSGGVDVFLFISAFLMTLSFTGKIERGERIGWKRLSTYWVHVFKRILPLAVLTVVLVLVGTRLFLGQDRWLPMIREAFSVVFYYENWYSIAHAVDYYASDSGAASPLRHFWSLSIQGQIFLAWPLLFALGAVLSRWLRINGRVVLALLFSLVFVASLTYSVIVTATDQTSAYFNTFARLWEFALGSLAAIVLPWIRLPRAARGLLNWVGLIMILVCGAVLDVQGAFPGYIALWPTLAAGCILVCGQSGTRWGADRLLSWKPLVSLGGSSYALYLVHWPLLVFYLSWKGAEKAGFFSGVGLLLVSLLAAVVLTRLVDAPLRSWKWAEARRWRALVVVGACLLLGAGPAFAWNHHIEAYNAELQAKAYLDNPGARSLAQGFVYEGDDDPAILPTAGERTMDWAWKDMGSWCDDDRDFPVHGLTGDECYHPVKNDSPTRTVVAVGNSHVEQWMPVLINKAQEENWDLVFLRHSGCFFTQADGNPNDECRSWLSRTEDYLTQESPDVLVMQATQSTYDGKNEEIPVGTAEQVQRWTERGMDVIGIRDNARFAQNPVECQKTKSDAECTFPHVTGSTQNPTQAWEGAIPGFGALDMDDLICPDGSCPPVIGNVYTYLDSNHLTRTYVTTTQEFFDPRLDDALAAADASS